MPFPGDCVLFAVGDFLGPFGVCLMGWSFLVNLHGLGVHWGLCPFVNICKKIS